MTLVCVFLGFLRTFELWDVFFAKNFEFFDSTLKTKNLFSNVFDSYYSKNYWSMRLFYLCSKGSIPQR